MSIVNSKTPLYQVIARAIKDQINAGQYKPGEKIPPIRQFTQTWGVNKATVHRAFECLKQEGLIENRVGSGSYVRYPEKIHSTGGIFDFRTDYLHAGFFPFRQAQGIINELFDTEQAGALAPCPAEGDPGLIRVLSSHYRLPAERMLIISGAQQGLDLVAKVFGASISNAILFEDPTYPGAITLFKARHFVPMQADGIDLDSLDRQLTAQIRLLYTMPSVHNPTGVSYSPSKKEAVARCVQKRDLYIIEDDYLGELKPALPRLIDIEPQRTIHIKSFAQTTMAGLRLGFMVVPADLYDQFVFAKYSSDISSTGLIQKFLSTFISRGSYRRHIENILTHIKSRRRRLQEIFDQHPGTALAPDQSGYSFWVKADGALNIAAPAWCKGEEFSFNPRFKSYFRLAFMHMGDNEFHQSLSYLDRLLGSGQTNQL